MLNRLIKIVTEFYLRKIKGSLTINFDGSGKFTIQSTISQDSLTKILNVELE